MNTMETPKPSMVRKYIYEYALISLTICVVYLFIMYVNLNNYIRDEYSTQREKQIEVISSNTSVLNDIKHLLINKN